MDNRNWEQPPHAKDEPDFSNLLAVLNRQVPKRPTLFELSLNDDLYKKVARGAAANEADDPLHTAEVICANRNLGYDYVAVGIPGFHFPSGERECEQTYSLNDGFVIPDRKSFDAYQWPDVGSAHYEHLDEVAAILPKGMKMLVEGPFGVLENVILLVGFQNLCLMIMDDEQLACDIFEAVGSRLVEYYSTAVGHEGVGGIICNDDWGFKTQTMLRPKDLRRFVFPWHRDMVAAAHAVGKPAILHSCGNRQQVFDDITDDMNYDGVHSYEDAIQPVENAYEQYASRTAIIGGIDVDFIVRNSPEEVYARSKAMLEQTADKGGYALGSGNSIPWYIPDANYFAMVQAALDAR